MSEVEMLPYKAINIFMEQDYLEKVLGTVITGVKKLPKKDQIAFAQFSKKHLSVLGFRDPNRAPVALQVNAFAKVFEERDDVIPFTLSIWTKINQKLAKGVKSWLEAEGFKNLALEREFDEEGGFAADWPDKLSFEKLVKKFEKDNPDVEFEQDDLILLALWISGLLPKGQSDI